MKQFLFKLLFPQKALEIQELSSRIKKSNDAFEHLKKEYQDRIKEVVEIRKDIDKLANEPKPTMADLMRDILNLPMLDFDNVDKKGMPPHPFEGLTKEGLMQKQAMLRDAHKNEALQEVMTYWINRFGNHALRNMTTDLETEAGVFSINGITAIRKELAKADISVKEGREPPEDFDPNGVIAE